MMDAELLADICSNLAEGKSLRAICRDKGLAESTVRYWLLKDGDAFAQSAHARELGCDAMADECIEIADQPGDPQDKRIRIDTRIRLIGKWSQRYSDKLTVNTNKTVTHKHDLGSLDTAELEQLESLLAKSERREGGTGEPVTSSVH